MVVPGWLDGALWKTAPARFQKLLVDFIPMRFNIRDNTDKE